VLLSLVVAMGTGCADDTPVATTEPVETTGTDSSAITFSMDTTQGSTAVVDDTSASATATDDTTTTTSDDTTTGGEVFAGQSISQLVSSGERTSSRAYTLVYTLGQPSALQSTHQTNNYSIHGGLIGANGSPP
jgi:hypothetical protein